MDKQQASDEKHRRFADKDSDFRRSSTCGIICRSSKSELFQPVPPPVPQRFPQLPAGARVAGYLYPAAPVVKELGLPINSTPSDYRSVHTALLTGLLSHIGQKDADKQEFTGARNARFSIFPAPACSRSRRSGPWWPNWWKPAACGAHRRAH